MKNALKTYFKRKDITKEEYKKILKRGVPQVCTASQWRDMMILADFSLGFNSALN